MADCDLRVAAAAAASQPTVLMSDNQRMCETIVSLAQYTGHDVLRRLQWLASQLNRPLALLLLPFPRAFAADPDPLYYAAPPNTDLFTPTIIPPGATFTPQPPTLQEDIDHESGWFYIKAWINRGNLIRSGTGPNATAYCLGNLSLAVGSLGNLNSADYSGAAGALSLLPTAGALIGSPTKELWVVFKLMPLAGVLSMFLSLGGTMVPTQAGAYDPKVSFTYGGMIATTEPRKQKEPRVRNTGEGIEDIDDAKAFSMRVMERAQDDRGGSYSKVWVAVAIQGFLIFCIVLTLYYAQLGAVIVWWCEVWGWMWFWYFLVVLVSIMENTAGIPFTSNWTLRITKAPSNIHISRETPKVQGSDGQDVLRAIHEGFNITSTMTISDQEAYVRRNSCFYVVISAEGVSPAHAGFRVLSKGSSVAVFAFGTSIFATASLMSISVALMVLCVVLSSGVFGRVTAMWIASEMNKITDPILHSVVRDRAEAARYVQEILNLPGLIVEIGGHVIINGRAVKRRNQWLCLSRYIGLLAAPFDATKLALRVHEPVEGMFNHTRSKAIASSSSSPDDHELVEMIPTNSGGSNMV